MEEFSNNCENQCQTKIEIHQEKQKSFETKDATDFTLIRRLDNFTGDCLEKFRILSKKDFKNFTNTEPEAQRASQFKKEHLSHKVLIGIEVYMPSIDVENNNLIPPKYGNPILKYREVANDKPALKTLDMVTENSKINVIGKRENLSLDKKDYEKFLSKINRRYKLFKNKTTGCKTRAMQSGNKIFSNNKRFNTTISTETNNSRLADNENSIKCKSPLDENETNSKQGTRDVKQKNSIHDFVICINGKSSLLSPYIKSNSKSLVGEKPNSFKKSMSSYESSVDNAFPEVSPPHIFSSSIEIDTFKTNSDKTTANSKSESRSEKSESKYDKTVENSELINEADLKNLKDENEAANIHTQDLKYNFHHPKSSKITVNKSKEISSIARIELYNHTNSSQITDEAEHTFPRLSNYKLFESYHRIEGDKAFRKYIPSTVKGNYYIDETPISNSFRGFSRNRCLVPKSEVVSRSTVFRNVESRTKFRDEKLRGQIRKGTNLKMSVASRRRLLQLLDLI